MTCEEALVLISGHIDAENTPEEEAQLRAHLECCPSCRDVLAAFEEIEAGVTGLEEEPPAGLREAVMAEIRKEKRGRRKNRTRWAGLAVAAALVVVMGAGLLGKPMTAPQSDVPAAAAARMMPQAETAAKADTDPQVLAEDLCADVAVTAELLPEMEVCPCETLESGGLLYCLETAEEAAQLSETYDLELYQPKTVSSDVSYALLLP